MSLIPKRPSLVNEVAEVLREGMLARPWVDHLPGERSLCRQLGVSRRTLQKALAILRQEKLFGPGRGRRRRIIALPAPSRPRDLPPVIGVLSSGLTLRDGFMATNLEQLRDWAHKLGLSVQVHMIKPDLNQNPQARLEVLLRECPARCWLLASIPEAAQRWFCDRGLPAVVIGHSYPGVKLPAVGPDYYATCRHAAGTLARLGHRHIGFLMYRWRFAGDLDSERGFRDGCGANGLDPADQLVVEHDGTTTNIVRVVTQLMKRKPRPTALLSMGSKYTITIATHLMHSGLCIPRDISLISREESDALHTVIPQIACYESLYDRIARRVFQWTAHMVETGPVSPRQVLLIPELKPGQSLAAPPKQG